MNDKLEKTLLLTKGLSENIGKCERWESLNDIVGELLENDVLDCKEYLHDVMELTRLGYVKSDLENEEDIEMSEAVGFDISGLTLDGEKHVEDLLKKPATGEKIHGFFKKLDEACGRIADTGAARLAGTIILPALALL